MADPDIVTTPEAETSTAVSTIGSESLHEFIRYFVASAVALAIDIGALWLLTSVFHVPYLVSGALAFTVGLITVYILSVVWVFSARSLRNPAAEFTVFALIGIVGLGLNEMILYALTSLLGWYYLLSKIASVVVVFSWNFAARKWLLFRSSSKAS